MAERRGGQVKAQALVGPTQMAKHIDVDRSYLDRLVGSGVLERLPGGFDIDATRLRYIEHLRAEKKASSPRTAADAAFTAAKTRLVDLRFGQQSGKLVHMDEAVEVVERLMGLFTAGLSNLVARVSQGDKTLKRRLEEVVFDIRNELADEAARLAKEEPEKAA